MKPEIIKNHAQLSAVAEEFAYFAQANKQFLEPISLTNADIPKMLQHYEYPLNSWPCFINGETKQILDECVTEVPKLIYKALKLEFNQQPKRLAEFFNIPEILASLFLDGKIDMVESAQRIDAIWTESGLKVMEVNVGSTIGGWQIQWVEQLYRNQEGLSSFFNKYECFSRNIPHLYFDFLVKKVQSLANFSGEVDILLVTDKVFYENELEDTLKVFFDSALEKYGLRGNLYVENSYQDVTFQLNSVYFKGKKLGAITSTHYLDGNIKVPQELYRAYLANQVFWPDNPYCMIIGDKRSLSILYQYIEHSNFTPDEQRCIKKYLPWTTVISDKQVEYKGRQYNLIELLVNNKDEFVIKIGQGLKGDDVYVGKFQTNQAWQKIVQNAIADNSSWLVQSFCESLKYYGYGDKAFSLYDVVWGIFGFGRDYGGCWLRLMGEECEDGVINSARGAQETIVFEVES